jgi:hypothetical protein
LKALNRLVVIRKVRTFEATWGQHNEVTGERCEKRRQRLQSGKWKGCKKIWHEKIRHKKIQHGRGQWREGPYWRREWHWKESTMNVKEVRFGKEVRNEKIGRPGWTQEWGQPSKC